MTLRALSLLAFGALAATGCLDPGASAGGKTDARRIIVTQDGAITLARSPLARDTSSGVPAQDLQALVSGNNAFAVDLFKKVQAGPGNVFLSPYSISIALALAWAGAGTGTEAGMAAALHFTLSRPRTHAAFNALDLGLAGRAAASGFQLHVVNQAWGEKTWTFLPGYLDVLAENYGAGMRLLDFQGQPEPSRTVINQWVGDQTSQKILDLIPPGGISPLTRLVLTNAIYFKADWADTFKTEDTRPQYFHRTAADSVLTDMMSRKGTCRYAAHPLCQAVELPYAGGAVSMTVLLPAPGRETSLLDSISPAWLDAIDASLQSVPVMVNLPKFRFTTGSLSLAEILASMGMGAAFSDTADFSGIDGARDLSISDVVHKAFVAVDEKGTEAAAATAVIFDTAAFPMPPSATFTADRPFLFLIRDKATGTILFFGKLTDPAAR